MLFVFSSVSQLTGWCNSEPCIHLICAYSLIVYHVAATSKITIPENRFQSRAAQSFYLPTLVLFAVIHNVTRNVTCLP